MDGGRIVRFPALAYCQASRDLRLGMERYVEEGRPTPILSEALELPKLSPNEDYADWRKKIHDGIFTLKHLSEVLHGPALQEWARLFVDDVFIDEKPQEAFEFLLMAERLGDPVDPDLESRLLAKLSPGERENILENLSADIPDMEAERAEAIQWLESFWGASAYGPSAGYDHEIEGYAAALNAGDCEKARTLVVAETSDASVEAFLGAPKDPWDQVSPKYDPALFQCRAEGALARGEVLVAGADLTVLADLLYDPALFTLAEIYSSGEHLPAEPSRAYRYLVLAEGFGASNAELRGALEDMLSLSARAEIDEEVKQGWPALFRNLKETGKAGLFAEPQPGLPSSD
jgi:hypothetical protein